MLHKLIVRNVVLISKLQIDFYNGLVVFSGETGAGKSILLDALGLALGRRAETRLVGNNDDLANVTAEFNLHKDHPIKLILQDKGIPIDKQDILILRRELRMADQTLDATGLNCPLPVLKAKKSIKSLETGQTIQILSTDPGSVRDFDSFCQATGNELLESKTESNGVFSFIIKKG